MFDGEGHIRGPEEFYTLATSVLEGEGKSDER